MADSGARLVTLPARGWAVAAVAVTAMLGLLTVQVVLLVQQKALIDHQESITERQAAHSLPVLRTVEGLLGDGSGVETGARRAGALVRDLRRADLPEMAALLQEVLPTLRRLPGIAGQVDRMAATVGRSYVTQRRSLDRTQTSVAIQRRTLAILRESLAVQQRTEATAQQTLAVARETLAHARSIDRKTGGGATGALPLPVP